MRVRDLLTLLLAAVLLIAGFTAAWWPLGLICAGVVVGAGWYWLIEEDEK